MPALVPSSSADYTAVAVIRKCLTNTVFHLYLLGVVGAGWLAGTQADYELAIRNWRFLPACWQRSIILVLVYLLLTWLHYRIAFGALQCARNFLSNRTIAGFFSTIGLGLLLLAVTATAAFQFYCWWPSIAPGAGIIACYAFFFCFTLVVLHFTDSLAT